MQRNFRVALRQKNKAQQSKNHASGKHSLLKHNPPKRILPKRNLQKAAVSALLVNENRPRKSKNHRGRRLRYSFALSAS